MDCMFSSQSRHGIYGTDLRVKELTSNYDKVYEEI